MKTLIISILLCIFPIISQASEIQFRVNRSYSDVVAAVEQLANEPRTVPFKVPNLPVLIRGKDIIIKTYIRPATRFYSVEISLDKPIGKLYNFEQVLEVRGQGDSYLVRLSVDLGYGKEFNCQIINRIKNSIITNIEYKILSIEKSRILYHASHMNTQASAEEYSWYQLITLFLDKLLSGDTQ